MPQPMTVHEMMEIHELHNFKTICTLKSKMMQGLARDEDLKALMKLDVQQSTVALQELSVFLAEPQPIQ